MLHSLIRKSTIVAYLRLQLIYIVCAFCLFAGWQVTVRGLHIRASGGGQIADVAAGANFSGPDLSGQTVAPSWGLYLRNLHESSISGLSLSFTENDDRIAIILDHCEGVSFGDNLSLARGSKAAYDVGLRASARVQLPAQIKTCVYPQCIF